jgi:hypothetical protein
MGRDLADPPGRLDPVHPGHAQIHEHDVGLVPEHAEGLGGASCRADEPDVRLAAQQQLEGLREHLVVVDHQYPGHRRRLHHHCLT